MYALGVTFIISLLFVYLAKSPLRDQGPISHMTRLQSAILVAGLYIVVYLVFNDLYETESNYTYYLGGILTGIAIDTTRRYYLERGARSASVPKVDKEDIEGFQAMIDKHKNKAASSSLPEK